MKFKARILNFDNIDSSGDLFPSTGKLEYENPVYVRWDGDPSLLPQGQAILDRKKDGIDAEIEVFDGTDLCKLVEGLRSLPPRSISLYPSVNGVVSIKIDRVIQDCKILGVDISITGNADRTIPPLDLNQGYDDKLENKATN